MKQTVVCAVLVLSFAHVQGQQLAPSDWRERDQSPRLEGLRKGLASGDTNTSAFWSEIEKRGTPLIEPLGEKHSLVTFLWRGTQRRETSSSFCPISPVSDHRIT